MAAVLANFTEIHYEQKKSLAVQALMQLCHENESIGRAIKNFREGKTESLVKVNGRPIPVDVIYTMAKFKDYFFLTKICVKTIEYLKRKRILKRSIKDIEDFLVYEIGNKIFSMNKRIFFIIPFPILKRILWYSFQDFKKEDFFLGKMKKVFLFHYNHSGMNFCSFKKYYIDNFFFYTKPFLLSDGLS
jgi:hypothetical protein